MDWITQVFNDEVSIHRVMLQTGSAPSNINLSLINQSKARASFNQHPSYMVGKRFSTAIHTYFNLRRFL